jgi:hypothetical protein
LFVQRPQGTATGHFSEVPLCEYAASGSGSGSGSASGGVNAFDDDFKIAYEARSRGPDWIGASDGDVVEQKNGSPLGIGRMSSKRDYLRKTEDGLVNFNMGHGTWGP